MKNKHIIEHLRQNQEEKKNDMYRYSAYNNIIKKLKDSFSIDEDITKTKIEALDITKHMRGKLLNIIGKSPLKVNLLNNLTNIPGIGNTKARHLINVGIKDIKDIGKYEKYLNKATRYFLEYKPLEKIPREYIKEIEKKLIMDKNVLITGSYKRKSRFSNDIDIVIINHIIDKYVKYLKKLNFDPKIYSKGQNKWSVIINHPIRNVRMKMDIFRTNDNEKVPTIIYTTGPKEKNIILRSAAKKKGYKLNRHGLFDLSTGKSIKIKSEKDLMDKI